MNDSFCLRILTKTVSFRKMTSSIMLLAFISSLIATPAGAQVLPAVGTPVGLTAGFQPPMLLGLKIHPENPLLFDFIVDQGAARFSQDQLKSETEKLVKYFLAALTIPDKEVWVNLSPYEKDRIIPDVLGQTIMGKTMLEQDYLLKQLASSLTNPDEKMGQEFWTKVKGQVQAKLGTIDVPMNTFNKVWIIPQKAEVLESQGIVLVGEKRLKLMMADEYETMKKNGVEEQSSDVSEISSGIFKTTILPNIEKEINEGKNFADVRQIYNAVILAAWYKKALKESLLGQVYADKGKVTGIETDDKEMKQKIYEQYLAAFKKGVYNLIKEESDTSTGDTIPRKYFSGGLAYKVDPTVRSVSSAVISTQLGATSAFIFTVQGTEVGPETEEIASSGVAENGTMEIKRSALGGADTIGALLDILKERKLTADQVEVFMATMKAKLKAAGKAWREADEDSIAIAVNTIYAESIAGRIPTDTAGITRIKDVNDALSTWRTQIEPAHPEHFSAGATPLLLDRVLEELKNPKGLRGHYLENGSRITIPLNGPTLTEVIVGNVKVNIDYSDGLITFSEGEIVMVSSGQDTFQPGEIVLVGKEPTAPGWEKTFKLTKAGDQVSQTHFVVKLVKHNGQMYLAIKDGNLEASSTNGTIVLNTGIPPEAFRVFSVPRALTPKTVNLGSSIGVFQATGTFDRSFKFTAGHDVYNVAAQGETLQFGVAPESVEYAIDREIRDLKLGEIYTVGRSTGDVDISFEEPTTIKIKGNGKMSKEHLQFQVVREGDHYRFTLTDLRSSNETSVTWTEAQASSAVTDNTLALLQEGIQKLGILPVVGTANIHSGDFSDERNYVVRLYQKPTGEPYTVVEVFRNEVDIVDFKILVGNLLGLSAEDLESQYNAASSALVGQRTPSQVIESIAVNVEQIEKMIAELNAADVVRSKDLEQKILSWQEYLHQLQARTVAEAPANLIEIEREISTLNNIIHGFWLFVSQGNRSAFKDWKNTTLSSYRGQVMYHVVPLAVWQAQRNGDYFKPKGFDADKFIRFASNPDAALAQANRLLRDSKEPVAVLKVDVLRARQGGDIVVDAADLTSPRLYNAVATEAVTEVIELGRDAVGALVMAPEVLKREQLAASSSIEDERAKMIGTELRQSELTPSEIVDAFWRGLFKVGDTVSVAYNYPGYQYRPAHVQGNSVTGKILQILPQYSETIDGRALVFVEGRTGITLGYVRSITLDSTPEKELADSIKQAQGVLKANPILAFNIDRAVEQAVKSQSFAMTAPQIKDMLEGLVGESVTFYQGKYRLYVSGLIDGLVAKTQLEAKTPLSSAQLLLATIVESTPLEIVTGNQALKSLLEISAAKPASADALTFAEKQGTASSGVNADDLFQQSVAGALVAAIISQGPGAREEFFRFIDQYMLNIYPQAKDNAAISEQLGTTTPVRKAMKEAFDKLAQNDAASARFVFGSLLGRSGVLISVASSPLTSREDLRAELTKATGLDLATLAEDGIVKMLRDQVAPLGFSIPWIGAAKENKIKIGEIAVAVQSGNINRFSNKVYPGETVSPNDLIPATFVTFEGAASILVPGSITIGTDALTKLRASMTPRIVTVGDKTVSLSYQGLRYVRSTQGQYDLKTGDQYSWENGTRVVVLAPKALPETLYFPGDQKAITARDLETKITSSSAIIMDSGKAVNGKLDVQFTRDDEGVTLTDGKLVASDDGRQYMRAYRVNTWDYGRRFKVVSGRLYVSGETTEFDLTRGGGAYESEYLGLPSNPDISPVKLTAQGVNFPYGVEVTVKKGDDKSFNYTAKMVAPQAAKASAPVSTFTKGGIDFDPTSMNLQIKRDGRGVPLPLPQQNLQQINIQGLVPIIINVVPINAETLPIFLGAVPAEEQAPPRGSETTASGKET